MYQALYRKWRPLRFADVIGQQHITDTLRAQMQSGRLSHAYLFTGTRGTGKTTCAKILARAVNCEHPVNGDPCNECPACRGILDGSVIDVVEIDAASNNGVDSVRDLRDDAAYSPSQVRKRVYIIDEVHMLSISAFNALLKIIEEPPEHLLFILATTELHKVPATILSRCQRFAFKRISQSDIAARLQYVAYQENIDLDDSAARILARLADGGMRDGLSLLDQCASATTGELNAQAVYDCLGIAGIQECGSMMVAIAAQDSKTALSILNRLYTQGKDLSAMLDELACLIRDLLILRAAPKEGITLLSGVTADEDAQALAKKFTDAQLVRAMTIVEDTMAGFTRNASRRLDAEVCLLRLCHPELEMTPESVNARLSKVEEQLATGQFIMPTGAPQPAASPAKGEELPPPLDDADAPPEEPSLPDEAPMGFWPELCASIRQELRPPVSGFFTQAQEGPVNGVLRGGRLELECANAFTVEMVNRPETLAVIARKASAMLKKPVQVVTVDKSHQPKRNANLDQLLNFGREHPDIISIKE